MNFTISFTTSVSITDHNKNKKKILKFNFEMFFCGKDNFAQCTCQWRKFLQFGKILLEWKTTLKITQQTFKRSSFHGNKTKFIYLAMEYYLADLKWALSFQNHLSEMTQWKLLKNDEKCFSFHLKSSAHS